MPKANALCGEPQPRLVCAEYFGSQVVVDAALLRTEDVHDKDYPEGISGRFYTLRANRVFRGTIPQTFKVYEGNDSGRASFDWNIGTSYMLFLFNAPVLLNAPEGEKAWSLEGCGNSTPAAKADSVLRQIATIKRGQKAAFVSGVVSGESLSAPLAHVHLMIRGDLKTFKAATDRSGRFQIEVPPGNYSVEPIDPPIPLEPYFLTYEDPGHLTVHPSGCVQVQFTESSSQR
jgi:hypothetical protein